jgi:hypothetical protein
MIWKCLAEGRDHTGIIQVMDDEYESLSDDPAEDIRSYYEQVVRLGYATTG